MKTTKREVWEGLEAMGPLAHRPWKQAKIALNIGRTYRRLRDARDDIDADRTTLLDTFAARGEDGGFSKEPDGSVRLAKPVEFNKAWRDLMGEEVEVELFPISAKLVTDAKINLSAWHLELLVNLGVLIEEDGDGKKEGKGKKDSKTEELAEA